MCCSRKQHSHFILAIDHQETKNVSLISMCVGMYGQQLDFVMKVTYLFFNMVKLFILI